MPRKPQTATEQPTTAESTRRTATYLPVLPDGWAYGDLTVTGPHGHIAVRGDVDGSYTVSATPTTGIAYAARVRADSFTAAVTAVARMARGLRAVAEQAKRLEEASRALYDGLNVEPDAPDADRGEKP